MEIVYALLKLGIKIALTVILLFYGMAYLFTATSNHCWHPMGCVDPRAVADEQARSEYRRRLGFPL